MKKLVLLAVAVSVVSTMSGCAVVKSGYNMAATPDADVCNQTIDKTVTEAEALLKMGKADAVKMKSGGETTRVYTKGSLKATLVVSAKDEAKGTTSRTVVVEPYVKEATCEQIEFK